MATAFSNNSNAKVTMYRKVVYANSAACEAIEFPFTSEAVEIDGEPYVKLGDEEGATFKTIAAFADAFGVDIEEEEEVVETPKTKATIELINFEQSVLFVSNGALKVLTAAFLAQHGRQPVVTLTGIAATAKVRNDKGAKIWAALPIALHNVNVVSTKAKWLFCIQDGRNLYVKTLEAGATVSFR